VYEDGGFALCAPPVTPPDPSRPLLVIIHPGDAIEDGSGYGSQEEAKEVVAYGRKNCLGMASEINEKFAGHDVVILHRLSSVDTFMRSNFGTHSVEAAIAPYTKACLKASEIGTVLYGDHLDECAQWLVKNMDVTSRPHIFMTGAYAGAEDGCVTYVGKALVNAGCRSISMSEHSPSDNCGHSRRWDPAESIAVVSSSRKKHQP
jgi:hypothetical protein